MRALIEWFRKWFKRTPKFNSGKCWKKQLKDNPCIHNIQGFCLAKYCFYDDNLA